MKSRPRFGDRPFGKRDARLLLVAYFDPQGIETILQSIEAWQFHSRHEVVLFNLWPGRIGALRLPANLILDEFDGVIVHPTVSYSPQVVEDLDSSLARGFAAFDGVKVLMKQDEQVLSGRLPGLVVQKGFDLVTTCLAPSEQEKVYPRDQIGDTRLLWTLTGYVTPSMRQKPPDNRRDITLSYRGSIQPLAFGRLGYEKRGIGYAMADALADAPEISHDISSRWKDRFSGTRWMDFLSRSRVVLGVESGANIFDFDGEVASLCADYERTHLGEDTSSLAYYRAADDAFLHRFEGNVDYAQISPRHLEAAAAGAAQLLYEGTYSGIFKTGVHFFPLRRDLKNLDAVLDFLRDDRAQREMAKRTVDEVLAEPRHWYEHFIAESDAAIDDILVRKGRRTTRRSPSEQKPVACVLTGGPSSAEGRLGALAEALAGYDVSIVGVGPGGDVLSDDAASANDGRLALRSVDPDDCGAFWLPNASKLADRRLETRGLLALLIGYAAMPNALLALRLGADIAVPSELRRFRDLCLTRVATASALAARVEELASCKLLVATDFDGLLAASLCADDHDIPVVADLQTRWADAFSDFQHWEIEFWAGLEERLRTRADLRLSCPEQLVAWSAQRGRDEAIETQPLQTGPGRVVRGHDSARRAHPLPSRIFGEFFGSSDRDVAKTIEGASVLASSSFFPHPNGADAVLRREPDGYAAGMEGSGPTWIEIDFGRHRVPHAIEIEFFDEVHYAGHHRILGRESAEHEWVPLASGDANTAQTVRHVLGGRVLRQLRIEADTFQGQDRLLLRDLRVMEDRHAADSLPLNNPPDDAPADASDGEPLAIDPTR